MFKKTINELKEINETPKEIVISTNVNSDKIAKNVIKTYAAIIGLSITARVAIAFIDSKNPKYKMPEN